jgi:spore germination cell wall hydrolase CwlJ-like protein
MKASRKRPKGAFRRPFGLVLCLVTAMPNSIGHQDLAALIARQPAVTERWRAHVRNSTFGTIHAASLSFPRLVGASIPDPYFTQLASIDPRALEATGSIPLDMPLEPVVAAPTYDFPVVDRTLKGDRLNVKSAPQPEPEVPSRPQAPSKKTKDIASRLPAQETSPAVRTPQQTAPTASPAGLPKADRLAASPLAGPLIRHAGIAAGEATLAKRVLGTTPRGVASVRSVERGPVRRSGLVVGQDTLAKRVLGLGPRRPSAIAAKPAEPASAPVAAVSAEVSVAAAPAKRQRHAGLAAAYLSQVRSEARRLTFAARAAPAETVDLESQRADLKGPIIPPAPVSVAEAPAAGAPQPALSIAEAAPAPVTDHPVSERQQAAEIAPAAKAEIADLAPAPDAFPAIPAEVERAVVEVALPAPDKTPDRFNSEAADKLASYAKPTAQNRVFFGTRELGIGRNGWEAWDPEEAPTVLAPPHVDTEIKRAALDPAPDAEADKGGETIAPKGEVTGEGKRPRTPAERLSLTGAARAKHQKCLANAIYFEARGEVERGQMAVAQVVLNRTFSGYYPGNVCDVVYQNAHRHLACQFTFACDNHRDVVRDPPRWDLADRIASDALDGKFWLPEIGKATHYHATYVNPWWVRTMTKHSKIGVHIFYRPTRWGSLDDIPVWGDRLEATGSIKREASPATPEKKNDDKRADAQPAATSVRRSIFDPVPPIDLPGG